MKNLFFTLCLLLSSYACYGQSVSGPTVVTGNSTYTYTFNSKIGGQGDVGTTCVVSVSNGKQTSSNFGGGVWLETGKKSVSFKVKWDNVTDKGTVSVRTFDGEVAYLNVAITKEQSTPSLPEGCQPLVISGKSIYNSTIAACAIEISDATIHDYSTVSIIGDEYVSLKPNFWAQAGSKVSIKAGGSVRSAATPIPDVLSEEKNANLNQNIPNPFTSTSQVSYFVPEHSQKAYLYIFDYTGNIVSKIAIKEKGYGEIILNKEQFRSNSIYLYSLIIDGKIIDTKKFYTK